MTKETALRILGLTEPVNKKVIDNAYRKLVQSHHPDKNPDNDFIYELNEAKQTLLDNPKQSENRALTVVVTNALMKYREAEKKEAELRNEASLLIAEKSKPRRNSITYLRDLSVVATFFATILGFAVTSTNSFLDFSYENDKGAIQFSKEALISDSTIRTNNYDSLYVNDAIYKKKIDDYYANVVKKDEKKRNSLFKFLGLFILGAGGVLIAQIQMRLKKYDTALDEFKSNVDSRVKLKSLLISLISDNNTSENRVSESDLKEFIRYYFTDKKLEESQFKSIITLARRLQLSDIEKVIVLKFLEKDLIKEQDFRLGNIVYEIRI